MVILETIGKGGNPDILMGWNLNGDNKAVWREIKNAELREVFDWTREGGLIINS